MIMIEIQYRGVQRVLLFASDRPLTSLDKLLKMLGKLKSVYHHILRFYNKTVTVTSLYWKLHYTALIATNASKNNYRCFVSQTNTGNFGGFLQVVSEYLL